MFEIGTGGFNGNKSCPHLTCIVEPNSSSIPDSILEFPTMEGYKVKMSDSDMKISIYSPLYPLQYYSNQYGFIPNPVAHGRYTLAGVIKLILFKYGHGNVEKFKSAKVRESEKEIIIHLIIIILKRFFFIQVRFSEPVAPGDNIQISTWNEDSRILFQGDVQRNGKKMKVLTGGYIDFNLQTSNIFNKTKITLKITKCLSVRQIIF